MRTLHLFLIGAVVFGMTAQLYAQDPPTVKVRTLGISANLARLDSTDGFDVPSNGLPNTVPNSKVYLEVHGLWSDNATAWASSSYAFTETPSGSASTLSVLDATHGSFVPDMEGTYKVEVTATDDDGQSNTAMITINVASYVGVGGIVENAAVPQCRVCHSGIADTWDQTGHAEALSYHLDDSTGHTRASCLGCHTTGINDPNATGNSFLQLYASSTWVYPTTLGPGNWEALKAEDPNLAKHANVQCESCHGPGSAHIGNIADNKIATTVNHQQCITCHDAPSHHIKPNEWRASSHFISVGESDDPEHMNRGSQTNVNSDCARCHTSNGFLDVHIKSANPPDQSFSNAPYDDPGAVGCATCHDPHSTEHEHQLRMDVKDLCASCHSIRVSGYSGLHSSHQGPMLNGQDGKEFPGYTYENSAHTAIAEQCATCHMAEPEDDNLEYLYGGHTFHVTYNNGTPEDETDDVLNSTGCVSCHVNGITITDVQDTQEEMKAKLDELKSYMQLRPDGRPLFPSAAELTTQTEKDAHWNWYFVANDNSYGVHNHKYALALLNSSIDEMKKITGIEPVDGSIPTTYALQQNFPNPFNPSTNIRYSIPAGTNVRLSVYDATGRLMSVLLDGFYQPGTYEVAWNGTTMTEVRNAPSGVYFYRIETDNYSASKKMVLMK